MAMSLTITLSDANAQRAIDALTALANNMSPDPPVVVNKTWAEKFLKNYLEAIVHAYETAQYEEAMPPLAPIGV